MLRIMNANNTYTTVFLVIGAVYLSSLELYFSSTGVKMESKTILGDTTAMLCDDLLFFIAIMIIGSIPCQLN